MLGVAIFLHTPNRRPWSSLEGRGLNAVHQVTRVLPGMARRSRDGSRASRAADGREDESVRVIKGIALGCALSVPAWIALVLVLRTALG